jgi:hypothetical protein
MAKLGTYITGQGVPKHGEMAVNALSVPASYTQDLGFESHSDISRVYWQFSNVRFVLLK